MTDQPKPERQDGDGLETTAERIGDEMARWSKIEVALRKRFPVLDATGNQIDTWPDLILRLPVRDAAEGAARVRVWDEDRGAYFLQDALPKPAPNAMRNAVARYLCKLVRRFQTAAECGEDCVMCIDGSGTGYWQDEADKVLALSAPVPPADETVKKKYKCPHCGEISDVEHDGACGVW